MANKKKSQIIIDKDQHTINITVETEMALDDARRIKVMSPGMLVFKRFIRNRLAVAGLIILFFMFSFSFLGPLFSPYTQTQVFKGIDDMSKEYASATYNTELRYFVKPGDTFGNAERAAFLLALGKDDPTFTIDEATYFYTAEGENDYRIVRLEPIAEALGRVVKPINADAFSTLVEAEFQNAISLSKDTFDFNNRTYRITRNMKALALNIEFDVALATLDVYDAYNLEDKEFIDLYDFRLASTRAFAANKNRFNLYGENYSIVRYGEERATIYNGKGEVFAEKSNIIVNPLDQSIFLSVDFRTAVRDMITNFSNAFTFTDPAGETTAYTIDQVNTIYYVKKQTPTELIRIFEDPSSEHLLGLDNNGMDVLTRLMHGGRVSLLVGFVVVFIEIFIGVIIGGISGYFGRWIDTVLMRFIDLFNSIPFYPMVLILGSVMDTLEVKPMARIFILMMVLGLLGWPGIARIVRGQILSLREQDFMIATEATGLSIRRRIFRHLVPNVMPLLIVQATAGLGGIIISEATLGFLGLGVKYPLASWGSIINVASEAFVMTNYWFMWIPAGTLILLTVLGFNFVGDGLRDAYDPKMKR
jgi:peptide/nickel transport system permease protein